MQIVIDISEEKYNEYKNIGDSRDILFEAIRKGTPLPKSHGDLKDTEKLKHAFAVWSMAVQGNFTDADIASIIYNSPTIIEAEREEE